MNKTEHIQSESSETARPSRMPKPTYFPFLMAFSVMFFLWGLISLWMMALTGLIGMGISLSGWISDLVSEFRESGD